MAPLAVPPWPFWLGAALLPMLVCGAAGWLELRGVEKRLEGELAPADSGTEDILRGRRLMNGPDDPAPRPSPWPIGNAPMLPLLGVISGMNGTTDPPLTPTPPRPAANPA